MGLGLGLGLRVRARVRAAIGPAGHAEHQRRLRVREEVGVLVPQPVLAQRVAMVTPRAHDRGVAQVARAVQLAVVERAEHPAHVVVGVRHRRVVCPTQLPHLGVVRVRVRVGVRLRVRLRLRPRLRLRLRLRVRLRVSTPGAAGAPWRRGAGGSPASAGGRW